MTGDCCVFKFLWRSVDRKHLMRFQSVNAVFKISPAYNVDNVVWTVLELMSTTVHYFVIVCLFIYNIYLLSEWLNK